MDVYSKQVRLSIGENFLVFKPVTIQFNQLPSLLCSSGVMYSPAQFNECKRKSANFKGFADFIVLDFDEGWNSSLDALFNQWYGFKVPTKSHMKEKNGIICERYRIILLLGTPINLSYTSYKRLYKHIIKDLKLSADTSCVDATRFYYSAFQPEANCIRLKGTQYFPWEQFNYKDFNYAPLSFEQNNIDISIYKDLDVSYFDNLQHSKRYPCPLCRLEGLDQKGHHLGFNKDEKYPTCFYNDEHSKILRKVYKNYKFGIVEDTAEKVNDMVRIKATPDLIKINRYDPKPANYSSDVHKLYDEALDILEKADVVGLDIETFYEEYVDETLEEAEARLAKNYKYIKGAYNAKWEEYKGLALDPFRNKIRIIGLGTERVNVPFDMYWVTDEQKQRILNIVKDKFIVGQNLKFDIMSIMASYGEQYCPKYCFDTMIASRMIHMAQDPEDQAIGHNLAAVAYRFLNYKMNKDVDHTWGQDNLTPRQLEYQGDDIKVLLPAYKEQIHQFVNLYGPPDTINYDLSKLSFLGPLMNYHPILALEMQTLLEVIRIEFKGVKPNIEMMLRKIEEYNNFIDNTDEELGINCGSSKQCVEYLQKYVNPSITSSAAGVLEQYRDFPNVAKIIESKAARTRRGLMESMSSTNVHPYDKRIHAHFNQLLNTGRFACSKPNMQQIPKDIKNTIYLSENDSVIFDTDYAAVELRIESVVANDPVMLEAYKNNIDMHYLTASKAFNKEIPHTLEEKEDAETNPNSKFINKWERGYAKAMNFGLIYGLHWTSFVAMSKAIAPDMTDDEAVQRYDTFFKTYTGVDATIKHAQQVFMQGTNVKVIRWLYNKAGSIYKAEKTVPFFTVCRTAFGRMLAVDTERKMMNFPTQGTGSDILKLALCTVGYNTRKDNTSYRTENIVHDDTIGESKLIDFDINSKHFRDALEFAVNYMLRYKFHTPVNQDFCILSLFGKEVFLEEALTVKDIKIKLIEKMNHDYEKYQKSEDDEEKVKYKVSIQHHNELLKELEDKAKELNLSLV